LDIDFKKHPSRGFFVVLSCFFGFSRATLFLKEGSFRFLLHVFLFHLIMDIIIHDIVCFVNHFDIK